MIESTEAMLQLVRLAFRLAIALPIAAALLAFAALSLGQMLVSHSRSPASHGTVSGRTAGGYG